MLRTLVHPWSAIRRSESRTRSMSTCRAVPVSSPVGTSWFIWVCIRAHWSRYSSGSRRPRRRPRRPARRPPRRSAARSSSRSSGTGRSSRKRCSTVAQRSPCRSAKRAPGHWSGARPVGTNTSACRMSGPRGPPPRGPRQQRRPDAAAARLGQDPQLDRHRLHVGVERQGQLGAAHDGSRHWPPGRRAASGRRSGRSRSAPPRATPTSPVPGRGRRRGRSRRASRRTSGRRDRWPRCARRPLVRVKQVSRRPGRPPSRSCGRPACR